MKFGYRLAAAIALLAASGCDAIMEPEGAPPPPPDQPPPPPLDDGPPAPPITEDTVFDGNGDAVDPFSAPPPDGDAAPPADASTGGQAALENRSTFPPAASLAELNAVRCDAVGGGTATVAQVAKAREPALDGALLEPSVVGAVGGAAALSVVRANYPGIVKFEPRKELGEGVYASGHCGATRIARHWFVTAAHCVDERYDQMVLKVGDEVLNGPVVRSVDAAGSICHAAYDGGSNEYANDIALLRVSEDVVAQLEDVPIAVRAPSTIALSPANTPLAMIAGWGLTTPHGVLSNTLLGTDVKVLAIGPALIKVASVEGRGPCVGDSGGPLFLPEPGGQHLLAGVLSGVEQEPGADACSGDYTARYTNLQGFSSWIDSVIDACESNPDLCAAPATPN